MQFRNRSAVIYAAIFLLSTFTACKQEVPLSPKPRPVSVAEFSGKAPVDDLRLVKASVKAWRTETVSMEVGGRLTFLAEEGDVFSPISKNLLEQPKRIFLPSLADRLLERSKVPLLVAQIDREKYEIQQAKANIAIEKTEASIKAAKVELEELLPAQKDAATAEYELAKRDFERAENLFKEKAGSEAEMLRYEAKMKSASAAVKQVDAQMLAKAASIEASEKQLLEDNKNLQDAKRNLKECDLSFSSFRGELTSLQVETGDLIQPNEPIGTIQMMDPIMIEFEVSSADSRRLSRMARLSVFTDGRKDPLGARVYDIDTVADPSSRTFTVTLLMVNQRYEDTDRPEPLPQTDAAVPMDLSFLGEVTDGKSFANEQWIFTDPKGNYVLKVTNWERNGPVPENNILHVEKVYVDVGELRVLFYRDVYFREIQPASKTEEPAKLDREKDLIVGKILLPKGADPATWDWSKNNKVRLADKGQWLLRPGELVDVDISQEPEATTELRVPIDAISYQDGKYYLFLLAENVTDRETSVEKVEIIRVTSISSDAESEMTTADEASSYLRIKPEAFQLNAENGRKEISLTGRMYVRKGSHYLRDGETVKVVPGEVE